MNAVPLLALALLPSLVLAGTNLLRGQGAAAVPPLTPPGPTTPIRVLISQFQDGDRCARTIGWALQHAKNPERLHFSVLQAISAGRDTDCIRAFEERHLPGICAAAPGRNGTCAEDVLARIQSWSIPLEEGMGAAHQRGLLSEMADLGGDTDMCLNIDSHMGFSRKWDEVMLDDWAKANNEFAILTTYPMPLCQGCDSYLGALPYTCGWFLDGDGVPRGKQASLVGWTHGMAPKPTMNWAAGLAFGRCHAERNVPVDKELHWIFDGEEVDRAVRFWTHGYDMYMPTTGAVTHDYEHAKQKFWEHQRDPARMQQEQRQSRKRIFALLGAPGGIQGGAHALGSYGLGTQRTLQQYFEGLGARFVAGRGLPSKMDWACGSIKRTPVRDERELVASVKAPDPPARDAAALPESPGAPAGGGHAGVSLMAAGAEVSRTELREEA